MGNVEVVQSCLGCKNLKLAENIAKKVAEMARRDKDTCCIRKKDTTTIGVTSQQRDILAIA